MAWDWGLDAKKKGGTVGSNFIYSAWYHTNGSEMCNEKKTKGKGDKDELPQGNHYHTSLLFTTHHNEDWMQQDAYSPERKHVKAAFQFGLV